MGMIHVHKVSERAEEKRSWAKHSTKFLAFLNQLQSKKSIKKTLLLHSLPADFRNFCG